MKSTMMAAPLSLMQLIRRARTVYPDSKIVSRLPDKTYKTSTYRELADRSEALANYLKAAGVKPGDRVATLCWNHHWNLEAFYGIPMAGGIMLSLNLRLSPEELGWIAGDAKPEVLIVDDILLPALQQITTYSFKTVIVVPFDGNPDAGDWVNYEDAIGPHLGTPFSELPFDEQDAVSLCYTSGTTGRPKGVAYSHRSAILHAMSLSMPDVHGIRNADTILPIAPMFHAHGWGLAHASLICGSTIVFPGPHLHAGDLLDLMVLMQPTFATGVPTIWLSILQLLKSPNETRSLPEGMRVAIAGSAVPESLIREYAKRSVTLNQMWGMTETSPIAIVNYTRPELQDADENAYFARRAMAGIPVSLVEARIVNDDGEAPWDGQTAGELQVRGPFIAGGYFQREPDLDKHTADGWLRTGDVGTFDRFGYFRISDRTKDLVKSGGEWISSVDVENILMGHQVVSEAAVIAIPSEKWGERPLACIVLHPDVDLDAASLNAHLLANGLAKWQLPDRYEILTTIPRTSTGKFWKVKLREMFPK